MKIQENLQTWLSDNKKSKCIITIESDAVTIKLVKKNGGMLCTALAIGMEEVNADQDLLKNTINDMLKGMS